MSLMSDGESERQKSLIGLPILFIKTNNDNKKVMRCDSKWEFLEKNESWAVKKLGKVSMLVSRAAVAVVVERIPGS